MATPLNTTAVFQRGGSIIPRRRRVRRSALMAVWDPISLDVAPDAAAHASGRLLLDDGESVLAVGGAALLRLAFACDAAGGAAGGDGGVQRVSVDAATGAPTEAGAAPPAAVRCALTSTPSTPDGAAPLRPPRPIVIERVLLRHLGIDGMPPLSSATLRVDGGDDGGVRAWGVSAHGVELQRLEAPALQPWTIDLVFSHK